MHHAYIDKFAYQDSPIHRLDSRVKFIVLLAFNFKIPHLVGFVLDFLFIEPIECHLDIARFVDQSYIYPGIVRGQWCAQ